MIPQLIRPLESTVYNTILHDCHHYKLYLFVYRWFILKMKSHDIYKFEVWSVALIHIYIYIYTVLEAWLVVLRTHWGSVSLCPSICYHRGLRVLFVPHWLLLLLHPQPPLQL